MLSVVVHVSGKPLDWHLVEPLFYKGRSTKQLHFFSATPSTQVLSYQTLYQELYRHLERNRISRWQLVLLMSNEYQQAYRMGGELENLHRNVISVFNEQGLAPVNQIAIVMEEREKDSLISETLIELDLKGYVDEDSDMALNHFTLAEIDSLHEAWGDPLDLRSAGTVDEPNDLFREALSHRSHQVKKRLSELVNEKKEIARMVEITPGIAGKHLLRIETLDAISLDFDEAMDHLIEPPLSFSLGSYQPSEMLKQVLKAHVSLSSGVKEFRIFRVSDEGVSAFQQTEHLLRTAFLINFLAMYPEAIDRIKKSSVHLIKIKLDEAEVKQMFSQYRSNLVFGMRKLSNRNLEGNHFMTRTFTETELLPNFSEALPLFQSNPPEFNWRKKRSYGSEWTGYLQDVEFVLEKREHQLLEEAEEGVWNLSVSKRQDDLFQNEKNINIKKYLRDLKQKQYRLHLNLDEASPSLRTGLAGWKKYANQANDKMALLLSSIPNQVVLGFTLFMAFFFLIVPMRTNLSLAHLLGVVLILVGLLFLSMATLIKPIYTLTEKTKEQQEEFAEMQSESLARYNEYLNKLYHLNHISKQIASIEVANEQQKQENALFRWHEEKMRDHLMLVDRLIHSFSFEPDINMNGGGNSHDRLFTLEKDVMMNPLYSLLDVDIGTSSEHSIEVSIGHSKENVRADQLKQITCLHLEEEQVLLL